jgi:hypothetical protein
MVTYETTSAPFLAVRSLQQLTIDTKQTNSRWHMAVILNNFYVDDVLTGADSEPEAFKLREQLVQLLKNGV